MVLPAPPAIERAPHDRRCRSPYLHAVADLKILVVEVVLVVEVDVVLEVVILPIAAVVVAHGVGLGRVLRASSARLPSGRYIRVVPSASISNR